MYFFFFFPYPTHQLFHLILGGGVFLNSCLNRLPCCFVEVLMEGCFMLGGGLEINTFQLRTGLHNKLSSCLDVVLDIFCSHPLLHQSKYFQVYTVFSLSLFGGKFYSFFCVFLQNLYNKVKAHSICLKINGENEEELRLYFILHVGT